MPRDLPPFINRLLLAKLLIEQNLVEVASLVKSFLWRGPNVPLLPLVYGEEPSSE